MAGQLPRFQGSPLDEIKRAIESSIPNSSAVVSGEGGHFSVEVVAPAFAGKSMLEAHRMVYAALTPLMQDAGGPVHAIDSLRTHKA